MEDRIGHLKAGAGSIAAAAPEVLIIGKSSVYESEPVGMTDQDDFYNAVVAIETTMEPYKLLELLQEIERAQGRQRLIRWGPRTLDLDLLMFGELEMDDPALILPHPRLAQRRFVLEPLIELAPDVTLPDGRRLADVLGVLGDEQVVWRVGDL